VRCAAVDEKRFIKQKYCKGQITVFLSIIMLSVVILAGVLIDGARIFNAEKQINRAVESAARSVLAGYCSRLKDEYGMFAICPKTAVNLSGDIDMYLRENLMIDGIEGVGYGAKYIDIFDYRIESLDAQPLFNFADNRVVKSQILEFMKYRAPQKVLEGIWDKFSGIGQSTIMAGTYKKKLDVDRILSKMSKAQQSLKKNIEGTTGDGKYQKFYVCKFNEGGSRKKAVENIASIFLEYKKTLIAPADSDPDLKERRLENLKKKLKKNMKDLRENHTEAFFTPNREAEKNIKEIMKFSDEAEIAVKEFESYVKETFAKSDITIPEFKNAIDKDIASMKELILDAKKAETLMHYTLDNCYALQTILDNLNEVEDLIETENIRTLDSTSLIQRLNSDTEKYFNTLKYNYINPFASKSGIDNRKEVADELKALLNDGQSEADIEKSGIKMEELPSHKKTEDNKYYDANITDVNFPEKLNNLSEEINFFDEDTSVMDNAYSFLSSINDVLPKGLTSLRDDIYINEYILGVFKNSVPALKSGKVLKPDVDFRGLEKSARHTFFQSEVEYILHGNSSESINKTMTKAQVMLIRFLLNTLHVYSDSQKRELAYGMAAAAVGWWTGGTAVPAVANLIMCGWGMGEAVIDVKKLLDGELVPFYKLPGDWQLNIGIPPVEGPKSNEKMSFSYYDYLRLFLLLCDSETKLGRIEDLIQLNMQNTHAGFKMEECCMYIKVEAELSTKYFFLTRPFMPAYRNTSDGRHRFKVVKYEGY